MLAMLGLRMGEYQDVIKLMTKIIDQVLEYGWGIGQAKQHDQVLEMYSRAVQRSLPLISFLDVDPVICIAEVKFSVDGCDLKEFKSRGYEW